MSLAKAATVASRSATPPRQRANRQCMSVATCSPMCRNSCSHTTSTSRAWLGRSEKTQASPSVGASPSARGAASSQALSPTPKLFAVASNEANTAWLDSDQACSSGVAPKRRLREPNRTGPELGEAAAPEPLPGPSRPSLSGPGALCGAPDDWRCITECEAADADGAGCNRPAPPSMDRSCLAGCGQGGPQWARCKPVPGGGTPPVCGVFGGSQCSSASSAAAEPPGRCRNRVGAAVAPVLRPRRAAPGHDAHCAYLP